MTSLAKTKAIPISDLIKMELDQNYTRDNVTLQNKPFGSTSGGSLTVSDPFGQPVRAGDDSGKTIFALATAETSVTGIYLDRNAITALAYSSSLSLKPVLARGPTIICQDVLPVNDTAGGTFTQATLRTRLTALGIICRPKNTVETDMATDPHA